MKRFFSFRSNGKSDPTAVAKSLRDALRNADIATIKAFIDKGLDLNAHLASNGADTMLMEAVNCSKDKRGSSEQKELIEFLLKHGADVNQYNNEGYNALHLALSNHELSEVSLLLIHNGDPDVNLPEQKHGNTPLFIAIREYGQTWRDEQRAVNKLRYNIIEELLKHGADVDCPNHHGVTPRFWTERLMPEDPVHQLLK